LADLVGQTCTVTSPGTPGNGTYTWVPFGNLKTWVVACVQP
jgi:hypothetical protein